MLANQIVKFNLPCIYQIYLGIQSKFQLYQVGICVILNEVSISVFHD